MTKTFEQRAKQFDIDLKKLGNKYGVSLSAELQSNKSAVFAVVVVNDLLKVE